jgi:hypothetical protein
MTKPWSVTTAPESGVRISGGEQQPARDHQY